MAKPYPKCPKCGFEQNDPSGHTKQREAEQRRRLAKHIQIAH